MSTIISARAPRTLILCFDGTADSFDDDTTNVVRLFAAFEKECPERQLCYYQPGIGTYLGPTTIWSPTLQKLAKTVDQALAWYLDTHIMGGYRFLMQNYLKGDKICMFGFSRGAYTARCLAGMLNKIGLLPSSNEEHVTFAYKRYVDISEGHEERARSFKETFSMSVEIAFMGVWDTVASCGLFGRHLPFTASNEIIRVFRHALALDERRGKFKPNQWHRKAHSIRGAQNDPNSATTVTGPLSDGPHRKETLNDYIQYVREQYRKRTKKLTVWSDDREAFDLEAKKIDTDVRELWFPGCHADVGGGSVKNGTKHSLANASLVWMVNNLLKANVGVIFKGNAFKSNVSTGLIPHFGGTPGVEPSKRDGRASPYKDSDSVVKLETVEEDNEKSESFDDHDVETTGVAYSSGQPTVTVTAPPPTAQESDQVASAQPPTLDRKRLSLRWLQRRQRMDVAIPQRNPSQSFPPPSSPISPIIASMQSGSLATTDRLASPIISEPQSRSSERTMFDGGNSKDLCWLSQVDIKEDANSKMVDQLDELKAWWILEWLPLWQHYQDRDGYWHKGFHFNRGSPRSILDPDPLFHTSAKFRTEKNYVAGARVQEGEAKYVDF